MSQTNYTPSSRKNKHLTERERYTIEILLKEQLTASEIAKRLGRHLRTIQREIAKGTVRLLNSDLTYRDEYCADRAQAVYKKSAANKGPKLKIENDPKLVKYIENKIIKENFSPDAVIGQIKEKGRVFNASICTKTLYNCIDKGAFAKE